MHLSNPTLIVVAAFCCAYLATSNPQILKVVVGRCLVGCCTAIRIRTQHTLVCLVHQAVAAPWQSNSRYGKMWTRQGSRTLMMNESKKKNTIVHMLYRSLARCPHCRSFHLHLCRWFWWINHELIDLPSANQIYKLLATWGRRSSDLIGWSFFVVLLFISQLECW